MSNRRSFDGGFKRIRKAIIERDRFKCVKCGLALSLEVHHIDGYENCAPEALVTLCYLCHGIAPMGQAAFGQWLLLGEDGIEVIRRKLATKGLRKIPREQIIIFCGVLSELRLLTNKLKLQAGLERKKATGVRCEGRLEYGLKIGEPEIMQHIMALHRDGLKLTQITNLLNSEGIPTRYGKRWLVATIARIIKREINKSALDK